MNDRDRLAADLRGSLVRGDGTHGVMGWDNAGLMADRLIALGWTRLDEERLARALQRVTEESPGCLAAADMVNDPPDTAWAAAAIAKAYREDTDA